MLCELAKVGNMSSISLHVDHPSTLDDASRAFAQRPQQMAAGFQSRAIRLTRWICAPAGRRSQMRQLEPEERPLKPRQVTPSARRRRA